MKLAIVCAYAATLVVFVVAAFNTYGINALPKPYNPTHVEARVAALEDSTLGDRVTALENPPTNARIRDAISALATFNFVIMSLYQTGPTDALAQVARDAVAFDPYLQDRWDAAVSREITISEFRAELEGVVWTMIAESLGGTVVQVEETYGD